MLLVITFVGYSVVSERHVSDCRVKKVVGEVRFFKSLHADVCLWVELLCDTSRNAVKLHSVELAVLHFFGNTAEEISYAHRRFKHIALCKAEVFKRLVHRADNLGRGVMRVQSAFCSRLVLIVREQLAKLFVFLAPLLVSRVKCLRHTAPADIFRKNLLLIGCSKAVFLLDFFQRFNRCDVILKFGFQTARADFGFLGNAEIVLFLLGGNCAICSTFFLRLALDFGNKLLLLLGEESVA